MAMAQSPFNLLPLNDETHFPQFYEDEVQLVLDAAFAEELQFQEALKASLFSCQMQTSVPISKVRCESSLGFCDICMEKKENDQLINNGEVCVHSFCLDCISKYLETKIKEGMINVTCPGLNCKHVLSLYTFKHLVSKDVFNLWEKALHMEMILPITCSKDLNVKTSSENGIGNGNPFTDSGTSENLSSSEVKTEKLSQSLIGTSNSVGVHRRQVVHKRKQEEPDVINVARDLVLMAWRKQSTGESSCNSHFRSSLTLSRGNERPKLANIETAGSSPSFSGQEKDYKMKIVAAAAASDDDASDSDALPDTDDYDSDSEASPRCLETCKKSKWFKKFVNELENLSTEIKDPARQWHCSACQGGAGAMKRYLGVQTLIQHAKTKGKKRVRLHQELAQLLEEKLQNDQAISGTLSSEASAKWIGLKEEKKDYEIVWPPMVVITNTIYKKDENNQRIGMTTHELLDLFSSYEAIVKAQHSYNSRGHCGISILIFESSAKGYLEAERLNKHFEQQRTDRNAWNSRPVYFLPSGERQLYGYLAMKEDVDVFNKNSSKPKLKYEMRSYEEMVVNRIRQMSEDNHQLLWLKNRVSEQEIQVKHLEESNHMLKEKLQKASKEMDIFRRDSNQHHQQMMEELECQEEFYKDQIRKILEPGNDKDVILENVEQSNENSSQSEEEMTTPDVVNKKNSESSKRHSRRFLRKKMSRSMDGNEQ